MIFLRLASSHGLPRQDDLESDEEQKSLEEAVRRYEKAAGLISDAAGTKRSNSLWKASR